MSEQFTFADRMAKIDASGIRKVFDLAATMKNPINLSIGQPDFDVPESIREEAVEAIRKGFNKYTQTQGLADLREAVWQNAAREFGWTKQADHPVLITSGVSGALMLAFLVLVNPGDEEAALRHTIEVYAAAKNRKGISIEASIRLCARQDANGLTVVEEVDAERLECTRRLFLARGLSPAEAAARSALLYAYVFGFSMMQCGRFDMDAAQTKRWIVEQIIK